MKLTPAKVTMLMLVAVAGLIGLYIVKGLFADEKKVERPKIINMPLAAAHLSPGTKITAEHIGMGPFPVAELKEDMLRSNRVIVGRVVKEAIKPGHPLRGEQLYEPGENAPLVVSDGKQAIALPVKTSAEMVDGLIKPRNFVDVHFTLDSQAGGTLDPRISRLGGVSMTLFKGVKVLALNKSLHQAPVLATGNSVTLELGAEQTNVLLVTQARGSISLTYNPSGEGDGGVALNNADRATLWEVLGLKKPATTGLESEKPFVTETFKGVHGGEVLWGKDGRKFEARAGGNIRDREWPAGSADAEAGGGLGGTFGGSDSNSDPNDSNSRRGSRGGVSADEFDPSDVFEPSRRQPAADPDIPENVPHTADRGLRSRTGSVLRVRPLSVGPTALHY